jgi:hypothetical protein
MVVDSLSNQFKQNITHKPVIKLSYNAKKINYSFGSGFGFTSFNLQDLTQSKEYIRVLLIFPQIFRTSIKVIVIYDSIIKELLNSPP